MALTLFFALAGVFLIGLFGIILVDSFVGDPDERVGLDERLSMIRATTPGRRQPRHTAALFDQDAPETPAPYYVRATRRG